MKVNNALFGALALLAVTTASNGATYTFTNSSGPVNTQSIVDSSGNFLNSGSVVIGSYLEGAPSLTSNSTMADILTGFTSLVTTTMGTAGTGATTIHGVFNVQTSGADPLDNLGSGEAAPWLGNSFYAIIGNALNIADSTQVLVFRFNGSIGGTEPVTTTLNMRGATANSINGEMVGGLGTFDALRLDPTPGNTGAANATFGLVNVVPEPSAALLGLLGAVGLIRRRR